MERFSLPRTACLLVCIVLASWLSAQQSKTLVSFDGYNGMFPYAPLVQGPDGNLYGTTGGGGKIFSPEFVSGAGTVFQVTPRGNTQLLYTFCSFSNCTDGSHPVAGLMLGNDGNLYGTTEGGGAYGYGTVFKITTEGQLTVLHSFAGSAETDGAYPLAGLVQATNGNFYGTTSSGGMWGYGSVFEITSEGNLTILYSFSYPNTDGYIPTSGLVQASNGDLYGTTQYNSTNGAGTIFRMNLHGDLTTIYSFCQQVGCTDGYWPLGTLIQGSDGNLYGTTVSGGANSNCDGTCGTVFRITPSGQLTILHNFDVLGSPAAGLVQGTNGDFYGTTFATAFQMTPSGELTTLYTFCSLPNCDDGVVGWPGLVQSTNGKLYGTTEFGGSSSNCSSYDYYGYPGCGVVFGLSAGMGPFVKAVPNSAAPGTSVMILGSNLNGATSVTFNGTTASFTVISDTEIIASVPAGAKTGSIEVGTPKGTLTSNTQFHVL